MRARRGAPGPGRPAKRRGRERPGGRRLRPAVQKRDDPADALAMAITFCHTNGNQLNRYTRRVAGPI